MQVSFCKTNILPMFRVNNSNAFKQCFMKFFGSHGWEFNSLSLKVPEIFNKKMSE